MPHHSPLGNYHFKFDLAAPEGWTYAPGDTIIGNLLRQSPIVTPEAVIALSFTGRVKVKVIHAAGNLRKIRRDSWQFLNFESVIFKGSLNLENEGDLFAKSPLTWPISVDIPYKPKPIEAIQLTTSCQDPFILETMFMVLRRLVTLSTTSELNFDMSSVGMSILMKPFVQFLRVTSQRLLPGMEDAELSVKQRAQKFFYSSKLPSFNCTVHLTVPAAIQLGSPNPIALQLEVVPDREGTSDSIKDVTQRIRVMEIQAILISKTHCLASTKLLDSPRAHDYEQQTNLNLQRAFTELESPLIITTGKGNEPVQIGNMFQLTLDPKGLRTENRRLNPYWKGLSQVYPDFTTYNIQHSHTIEWKISLNIAGEKMEYRYFAPTEIIAPA
ncbi:uncharacterized protein PFLUO_LOCUS6780 [Penicillium psychrofluorescens]|uniref:uncharacterized protein n=1 Tax=Penicillium psychrofluorescens TaxID=3158075 RepID=UPI003CCD639C